MQSDDEIIVNRCLQGDQAAFAFLVEKYKGAVHAYAYHRVRDYQKAQDIVQEVFIKAYKKLAQLKWPHRFQSWLYTIASNECSTWLRENLKEREQEVPLEDVPVENLDELAVRAHSDKDIELTVRSAMETLSDDSQLALSLYYMSGLSIREVAGFMGISPNNVGVKLHRARKQLGERLEKMLGKQLSKEKLRSWFTFTVMDSIRDMPIPSLPKPRPIKWGPIPISIGAALLIGVIGFGISSGRDVSQDMPVLKPLKMPCEVSLLSDLDSYLEQAEAVTMADEKLSLLSGTEAVIGEEGKEFNIRKIWADPDVDFYGEPSPDGRYLSYVDWEAGDSGNNDLAIYELATGKKRRLTDNASWYESDEYQFALYSRWSPDGKQIAYQWWSNLIELCVIGLDGSKPRTLYSPEEGEWARPYDWTPDGRQILACVTEKDGKNKIVLFSAADGSVRVLKTLDKYYGPKDSSWYTPKNMSFSPDGRYIVYDFPQEEDSHDISLISTDGSREIPLVEHPADDYVLGWAPDGENILFSSDRTGTLGIWLIAIADGKPQGTPELVRSDIGRFHPMGFTRKGSFYYGISQGKDDVYIAELHPETGKIVIPPKKVITRSEGSNIASGYSPDGKYLAYIYKSGFLSLNRSRCHVLCIRSLETGKEREFSFNLDYVISHSCPRWSPDCRSILVTGEDNEDGVYGIFKIDVQTGGVKPVTRGSGCEWSRDGEAIFFLRRNRELKALQILVRDLETGKEKELYRSVSDKYIPFNISLSPDGQWLALRCIRPTSLKVMPATGGEPRELPEFEKMATIHKPIAWTPDGRYIIFSGKNPGSGGHPLYRISVESGEIDRLGLKMSRYHSLSVHPDGKHIAFSCWGTTSKSGEVWVMENLLPGFTAGR